MHGPTSMVLFRSAIVTSCCEQDSSSAETFACRAFSFTNHTFRCCSVSAGWLLLLSRDGARAISALAAPSLLTALIFSRDSSFALVTGGGHAVNHGEREREEESRRKVRHYGI